MNQTRSHLEKWHKGLRSNNQSFLDDILDDACVFTSPIVFKPIQGKEMSKLYLMGAGQTFDMERFKYVRELVDGLDCVLEFKPILVTFLLMVLILSAGMKMVKSSILRLWSGRSKLFMRCRQKCRSLWTRSKSTHKKRSPFELLF